MFAEPLHLNTGEETENVRKGKSPTVTQLQGCLSPGRESRIDGNNGISNWTMLHIMDVSWHCFSRLILNRLMDVLTLKST